MKKQLLLFILMLLAVALPSWADDNTENKLTIYGVVTANHDAEGNETGEKTMTIYAKEGQTADDDNGIHVYGNENWSGVSPLDPQKGVIDFRKDITSIIIDDEVAKARPTQLGRFFRGYVNLTSIIGLNNLNTTQTTNMEEMFADCYNLTSLDLSNFSTDKVTTMEFMFFECKSLKELNFPESFKTENVKIMHGMFETCTNLEKVNTTQLNTSNVTTMDHMFANCSKLTELDVTKFDTKNVTTMCSMFEGCSGLTGLDVTHFDTGKVTDMQSMFNLCSNLTSLDVTHFNTANVLYMQSMFAACVKLNQLDVTKFNTQNVTNMSKMFYDCHQLATLDVTHFDTRNVTAMRSMFSTMPITSLDVTNFNTSKVTDMGWMFHNCSKLTSLDVTHFDTGNVTDMEGMFSGCGQVTDLDVSGFNTEKVTTMGSMFNNCSNQKSLKFGDKFKTSKVTNISNMFNSCKNIKSLDISNWDLSKIKEATNFAWNCISLQELNLGGNDIKSKPRDEEKDNGFKGVGTESAPCHLIRTFDRKSLGNATIDRDNKDLPPYYNYLNGYFYIADVLDCNEGYTPVKEAKADADLWQKNRTLKKGKWNTLVLPVDLTRAQLDESLGEGAEVCKLKSYSYSGKTISFETVKNADQVIPANVPVLVKPAEAKEGEPALVNNLAYVNVTIQPVSNNLTANSESSTDPLDKDKPAAHFIGSYDKEMIIDQGYFYFYENRFLRSAGKSTVGNTRGYFQLDGIDSKTPIYSLAFKLDDGGISTNIDSIDGTPVGQPDGPVYNLSGQRVGNDYKGIVIINGRKVLRK